MTLLADVRGMSAIMDAKSVARRLCELRTAAGLTREELAERTGINPRTLEGYEQGRATMAADTMLTFAAALGVSADEFARDPISKPRRGRPPTRRAD